MIVFPAIDIYEGKAVRLRKGDFNAVTEYGDNPAGMARRWADLGAEYLHVVDLDGALAGASRNTAPIREILKQVNIPIEVGGGIRTLDDVKMMLDLGVRRVILGSAAVKSPQLVAEACRLYGEKIAVGIDARDGIVAVNGWGESGKMRSEDLARDMAGRGVKTIIYTDISRDGTLSGVNIDATVRLARAAGVAGVGVVASGGVSSLEDIRAVKAHEKDGLVGVITGKAIYDGRLDLKEALRIAAGK